MTLVVSKTCGTDVGVFLFDFTRCARRSSTLLFERGVDRSSGRDEDPVAAAVRAYDERCLDVLACATLPKPALLTRPNEVVCQIGMEAHDAGDEMDDGDARERGDDADGDGLAVPQTLMTTTEFVGSIDCEALVTDFVRSGEDILEKAESMMETGGDDDVMEQISVGELRDFASRCEILRERSLLNRVDKNHLVNFLTMLERIACHSRKTMIEVDDKFRGANAQTVLKAVEALGAYFVILSCADMPKQIYREEAIDSMVEVMRTHLIQNYFVFYDASLWNVHRIGIDGDGAADEGGATTSTKKSSSMKPKAPATTSRSQDSGIKIANALGAKLGVCLSRLSSLIGILTLPDATVLLLTTLAFSAFSIENINFVQIKAVELVVSVFNQYGEHRAFIIDSIITSLLKLPAEGRGVRSFNVPGEDTIQIQALMALLMKCLQTSVEFIEQPLKTHQKTTDEAVEGKEQLIDVESRSFGTAFYWTNYFWKDLLTRWPKVKAAETERQIRSTINNALLDALECRNLPEWPVSNLLVLNLAGQLLGTAGLQSKDAKMREVALDFLGQVALRLKADALYVANDNLWDELPNQDDMDFSSSENWLDRATMFAYQDAARVGTQVDATTTGTEMVVRGKASDSVFAMESMLARFLAENNRKSTSVTSAAPPSEKHAGSSGADAGTVTDLPVATLHTAAFTYHIAQFARDAERAGTGFRQEMIRGGSRAMYCALHTAMMRVAQASDSTPSASQAQLPRELARSLCVHLNAHRPLSRQLDVVIQRITAMLDDASSLVRTAAMRAIGGIINEDPALLESPQIMQALKVRLKDSGSSVRAVTVDVIGRQIVRDVTLARHYYKLIEDRISDVGVSVRKRVISTFHECLRNPDFPYAEMAMKVLAFRILDEEESVRLHVVKIFRELWFTSLESEGDVSDDEVHAPYDEDERSVEDRENHVRDLTETNSMNDDVGGHEDLFAARTEQIVSVAWDIYCLVSRSGSQKIPLLPTFPLVVILDGVLNPSEDEKLDIWVNVQDMQRISRRVSMCMLHALIESEAEENERAPHALGDGASEDGALTHAVALNEASATPMSVKYALGLHILSLVDPCLCLPSHDPTYFAAAVQPYLKRVDDHAPYVSEKLQCCMSIMCTVAKHAGGLPLKISVEMERDLRILLLRHHDKAVIFHACKTLCAIAETSRVRDVKECGTISMVKRFVSIAVEAISSNDPLDAHHKSHCARALYVLGNISRFGADIVDGAYERNDCDLSTKDLLRIFRKVLEKQTAEEYELTRSALGACGDLFVARPELMFNSEGGFGKGSFDPIMRAALATSAERSLKEQALSNLSELIREEEYRMSSVSQTDLGGESILKSAQKRAKQSEKLQIVNGQADRSIAGGIAQRYWDDVLNLCIDTAHGVRLRSLHLVELVLRQGLVHPASAFPMLVALQIDPVSSVKRLGKKLLKVQLARHSDFFEQQLTQGVETAYLFKKRLETAMRRRGDEKSSVTMSAADGFVFVYSLVNTGRASRNAFLNTLLRRFETSSGTSDVLFLRFLASLISELPFTSVDEALYVVYQLNRVISLKGGLLLERLEACVKQVSDKSDEAIPDATMKAEVELACALSVALLLKSHVKRAYDLSDARVASYVPTEAMRNAELVRFDGSIKFDSASVDAVSGQNMGAARRAIERFQDLMLHDASDYADDSTQQKEKKTTGSKKTELTPSARTEGRRASRVIDDDDDDDDDDNDGQKDGEYLPKIRSAGLTTGKKRPLLRQRERAVSKRLRFDDSN